MRELELGLVTVAGVAAWAFLVGFLAFVVELVVSLRGRALVAAAGRPTRPVLLPALALCLVVPALGGYVGCTVGSHRGTADLIEELDPARPVSWALDHGAQQIRDYFKLSADDAELVEIAAVRKLARDRQRAATGISGLPERAWWWSVDTAIARLDTPKLTLHALVGRAQVELDKRVRSELAGTVSTLRRQALQILGLYAAFLVLINALAWRYFRRLAGTPRRHQTN